MRGEGVLFVGKVFWFLREEGVGFAGVGHRFVAVVECVDFAVDRVGVKGDSVAFFKKDNAGVARVGVGVCGLRGYFKGLADVDARDRGCVVKHAHKCFVC